MKRRPAALATGLAAGLTVSVLARMRREFDAAGELSAPTVAAMYTGYAVHAAATAHATRYRTGPLPLPSTPAAAAGAMTGVGGAALCAIGMNRFAGPGQVSGTHVGDLATGGVYRYTRNPQYTGYIAVLAGLGLARRSAAVLGLAGAAALIFAWWIPVEERHLEQTFGDAYHRYRTRTPRWLGRPA